MEQLKVILVDDEMLIRKSLRMKIDVEKLGLFIIAEFSNTKKALEKLSELEPDIIITDICMPGMDGIEFSEECIHLFPQIKVIILTGYDEFNYAMRSIKIGVADYLLKPIKEDALNSSLYKIRTKIFEERSKKEERKKLEMQIKEHIPVFREKFLIEMMHRKVDDTIFRDKMESYQVRLHPTDTRIQIAAIEVKPVKSFLVEHSDILLYLKARELIEQFFESDEYLFFFKDELGRIIIANNNPTMPFIECLDLLQKMIITRLKCYINIGISLKKDNYQKLGAAYKEAIEALNIGSLEEDNCILSYSNLGKLEIEVSGEEQSIWNEIASLVQNGMVDKIENQLLLLWKLFEDDKEYGVQKAKIRIGDIYSWCLKIMVSMQIEGYYKKLGKLEGSYELDFNLQTMYQIAKEVLLYTASEIARINEREKGDLIEEIQTFLIKNMDKPQLNMNDVAEQFHISAGYMGRLFKKFVGKTYSEYLSEIRLHKAKDLLLHSELKGYEIGTCIGIHDAHYLSIWFKKMTGFSLSEYRRGSNNE